MVFFSDQDGKQAIYNCWPYAIGKYLLENGMQGTQQAH